jgi:hypothetical protein
LEGRNHAAKRQHDMLIGQAWHTEAFAREKRLKPLAKYLSASQPRSAQGSAEMLATLREIQARGAVMNIRKVES